MSDSYQERSSFDRSPLGPPFSGGPHCEVAMRAQQIVAQHGQLRRRVASLEFELNGGVLVVRGCVPTYYLKQMVQTVLKGIDGVARIENQVEVVTGMQ